MSMWSLSPASEQALLGALHASGTLELVLEKPSIVAFYKLCIELAGDKLEAVITHGSSLNSITLQAGDPANAQHLGDYIEAIANGTAVSSSAPTPAAPHLLPCRVCGQEAIGYSYTAPGSDMTWLHGAGCRYTGCQKVENFTHEALAADAWNNNQSTGMPDHVEEPRDMVNHPPHYTGHPSGVECIDVAEELPFNLGNAFKYVFRYRAKNGRQDLEKARWYVLRQMASDPDTPDELGFCAGELVAKIAQHESYPVGRALVCIAHGGVDLPEALGHIEHLLKVA